MHQGITPRPDDASAGGDDLGADATARPARAGAGPVAGAGPGGAGDPTLAQVQDRFIAVWGQMAGAWGISRTMAEVHALLYISGRALNTDDIMERLQISRGNASMSLRALMDWGIVERTHRRGDRKEYFRAEQDVWALFRAIVRQRVKREVDPLVASLYEIRDLIPAEAAGKSGTRAKPTPATTDAPTGDGAPSAGTPDDARAMREHAKRLDEMLDFFRTLERLAQGFVSPAGRGLQAAAVLLRRATDAGGRDQRDGSPR